MRILLIIHADEEALLVLDGLARTLIGREGCRRARDLHEGIRLLQGEEVDLAILELVLPDAEGVEGIGQLVAIRPELPVVALARDPEHAGEALRLGAQDCLILAELQPTLLERALRYACDRKRHENEIIALKQELEELSEKNAALAMTDPLTGLGNRRAFDRTIDEELRRAARTGSAIGLLLVDLDRFKTINDGHGHAEGDRVLVATARSLAEAARRAGERAFRIGGDEFAVVVACAPGQGLGDLARRVREIFAARRPLPEATLSLGCACVVARRADARRSLLRRADEALYAAKEQGGDRHVIGVRAKEEELGPGCARDPAV